MWTAAGAGALRANTHRCIQSMGSNRCITCVNVLHNKTEGPKSSLQIKVYFGFYLKIKVGEAEVQCGISTACDDLRGCVTCWCWCSASYRVQRCLTENFTALCIFFLCLECYGDADVLFQEEVEPAHNAKNTNTCFNRHWRSEETELLGLMHQNDGNSKLLFLFHVRMPLYCKLFLKLLAFNTLWDFCLYKCFVFIIVFFFLLSFPTCKCSFILSVQLFVTYVVVKWFMNKAVVVRHCLRRNTQPGPP